jgi:hypothetical protein
MNVLSSKDPMLNEISMTFPILRSFSFRTDQYLSAEKEFIRNIKKFLLLNQIIFLIVPFVETQEGLPDETCEVLWKSRDLDVFNYTYAVSAFGFW